MSQHGGDLFFAGVARTMVAKPILPSTYYSGQTAQRSDIPANVKAYTEASVSELQQRTKTKAATGGGIGRVRDPASPTKAQRAAAEITGGRTPLDRGLIQSQKK